jgi:hypothetical protein
MRQSPIRQTAPGRRRPFGNQPVLPTGRARDQPPISDDIATRGYEVTTGPEAMMPPDTDVLVTYWDKWMWDITMYMIELDITLHDADTGDPLAVGNSMHASLTRLSPEEMIKEVLDNIFAEMNAQVAQR